jgi:hypothetical protein
MACATACGPGMRICSAGVYLTCDARTPTSETCNAIDDDCDGSVDETLTVTCYDDDDDDSYAATGAAPTEHCPVGGRGSVGGCPFGLTNRLPGAAADTDCDDAAAQVHPGAAELCDAARDDEDCDGVANPSALCECSGSEQRACPQPGRCADGTQTCASGAWGACSISPGTEACNAIDDDCDGTTDEGLATRECYPDLDRDGWVDLDAMPIVACLCPAGTDIATGSVGDCDDTDRIVNPGQTAFFAFESLSHGWDYDCNGTEELEHTRFGDMCNFSPMCSSPGCSPLPHYPGESAADLPGCGVGARQFTCTCYEDVDFTACINQAPSVMVTQRCR